MSFINKEYPNPWKTVKSEVKYENAWIKVTEHDVINAANNNGIYGTVHFKNIALGIIPLDKDYNTWIIGQHRFPLDIYSWEIPEGGGKIGVSSLESAKRELKEESGLLANKWTIIQELHLSNSVSDEYGIIYLAQELTELEPEPEENEQLEIKKLPFKEVYEMVNSGIITDSVTVTAVLKIQLMITKGQI